MDNDAKMRTQIKRECKYQWLDVSILRVILELEARVCSCVAIPICDPFARICVGLSVSMPVYYVFSVLLGKWFTLHWPF